MPTITRDNSLILLRGIVNYIKNVKNVFFCILRYHFTTIILPLIGGGSITIGTGDTSFMKYLKKNRDKTDKQKKLKYSFMRDLT